MQKIIIDPLVCSGAPIIDGTRLTVGDVIQLITIHNNDVDLISDDFELPIKIIKQAVYYCKDKECTKDNMVIKFCHNCILRELNIDRKISTDIEIIDGVYMIQGQFVDNISSIIWLFADKISKEIYLD